MIDLSFAFSPADYRSELIDQPTEALKKLAKGLRAVAGEDTPTLLKMLLWIEGEIEEREPRDIPVKPSREVVEEKRLGRATYRNEKVNCGKERCKKCRGSAGHGPYWYGYQKINGKMKSWYIGKELKTGDEGQPEKKLSAELTQACT